VPTSFAFDFILRHYAMVKDDAVDTLAYTAFPSALPDFHSSIMPALVGRTTKP